jgi:hypothetical protein
VSREAFYTTEAVMKLDICHYSCIVFFSPPLGAAGHLRDLQFLPFMHMGLLIPLY